VIIYVAGWSLKGLITILFAHQLGANWKIDTGVGHIYPIFLFWIRNTEGSGLDSWHPWISHAAELQEASLFGLSLLCIRKITNITPWRQIPKRKDSEGPHLSLSNPWNSCNFHVLRSSLNGWGKSSGELVKRNSLMDRWWEKHSPKHLPEHLHRLQTICVRISFGSGVRDSSPAIAHTIPFMCENDLLVQWQLVHHAAPLRKWEGEEGITSEQLSPKIAHSQHWAIHSEEQAEILSSESISNLFCVT
jgi:hypothetical protein